MFYFEVQDYWERTTSSFDSNPSGHFVNEVHSNFIATYAIPNLLNLRLVRNRVCLEFGMHFVNFMQVVVKVHCFQN